jgi:hypothetical protein
VFESAEPARSEKFSYLEGYYNRVRLHSSLGYLSPLAFEERLRNQERQARERKVSAITWPSQRLNLTAHQAAQPQASHTFNCTLSRLLRLWRHLAK